MQDVALNMPSSIKQFALALLMIAMPTAALATGSVQSIAYIYGDVSADGDIPSGSEAPYDQMLLSDSGKKGLTAFRDMVQAQGYQIDQYYDRNTTLNAAFLNNFDVIVFGLHQKIWSSSEKSALDGWIRNGGGILMYSDSAAGGFGKLVGPLNTVGQSAVNNVLSAYGMQVTVDQVNGKNSFRAGPNPRHPIMAGRPVFEGEGVSPIAIDPSGDAKVLIPYEDNADYKVSGDGTIKFNRNISYSNPKYAVIAATEVGSGHVMAIFDRQPIWNSGGGSNIQQRDNREILRRIINFLADKHLS